MRIRFLLLTALIFGCFNLVTAQSSKRVTAQEKAALTQLVLKDKKVEESIQSYGTKAADVEKGVKVEKVDLNRDGRPEYLVTLEESMICGAHANCPHWVFRKTGDEYQSLLLGWGQELSLEKASSGGYRNLRTEGADSAIERSATVYKFDGSQYKAVDCMTFTFGKGKKFKVAHVKCEEGM